MLQTCQQWAPTLPNVPLKELGLWLVKQSVDESTALRLKMLEVLGIVGERISKGGEPNLVTGVDWEMPSLACNLTSLSRSLRLTLAKAAQHPATQVRARALRSLQPLLIPELAELIRARLQDDAPSVREVALECHLHLQGQTEEELVTALRDPSTAVKRKALRLLQPKTMPVTVLAEVALLAGQEDEGGQVREAASRCLQEHLNALNLAEVALALVQVVQSAGTKHLGPWLQMLPAEIVDTLLDFLTAEPHSKAILDALLALPHDLGNQRRLFTELVEKTEEQEVLERLLRLLKKALQSSRSGNELAPLLTKLALRGAEGVVKAALECLLITSPETVQSLWDRYGQFLNGEMEKGETVPISNESAWCRSLFALSILARNSTQSSRQDALALLVTIYGQDYLPALIRAYALRGIGELRSWININQLTVFLQQALRRQPDPPVQMAALQLLQTALEEDNDGTQGLAKGFAEIGVTGPSQLPPSHQLVQSTLLPMLNGQPFSRHQGVLVSLLKVLVLTLKHRLCLPRLLIPPMVAMAACQDLPALHHTAVAACAEVFQLFPDLAMANYSAYLQQSFTLGGNTASMLFLYELIRGKKNRRADYFTALLYELDQSHQKAQYAQWLIQQLAELPCRRQKEEQTLLRERLTTWLTLHDEDVEDDRVKLVSQLVDSFDTNVAKNPPKSAPPEEEEEAPKKSKKNKRKRKQQRPSGDDDSDEADAFVDSPAVAQVPHTAGRKVTRKCQRNISYAEESSESE